MSKYALEKYLDDLENRFDRETEDALENEWATFLRGESPTDIFSPSRAKAAPPSIEWPRIFINDALGDQALMLLRELAGVSDALTHARGSVPGIRSNYGTSILSSLFGVEIFFMARDLDTLPTNKPLPGGTAAIRKLVDAGVPDIDRALTAKAFDTAAYYVDALKPYPKIREYVRIYHPDFQGPVDILELVWGSDFFMEFYDNPELVKECLELMTETYISAMTRWNEIVPPPKNRSIMHWSFAHRGTITLRNDSAMNLSPETYEEFVMPHDHRLLEHFGGGVMHFCGRGDHWLDLLARSPHLTGINMSQPHYNDMEKIYRHTIDLGIPLLSFNRATAEAALAAGRTLRGRVHCA